MSRNNETGKAEAPQNAFFCVKIAGVELVDISFTERNAPTVHFSALFAHAIFAILALLPFQSSAKLLWHSMLGVSVIMCSSTYLSRTRKSLFGVCECVPVGTESSSIRFSHISHLRPGS